MDDVPIMPTMCSMSLAGGVTDDRALLCSLTHSSMNFPSVISGSEAERAPESRRIQAHSNISAMLPMLRRAERNGTSEGAAVCEAQRHLSKWNRKLHTREEQDVLYVLFLNGSLLC